MDGVVDQIVQQERERRRLEEEAKKRQDAAYNVVMALPVDEQPAVVVRLLDAFAARGQREPAPKAAQSAPKAEPSTNGAARRETFVDKAEAFVLAHPEGVKTRQVADAIGQDVSAVDTTLRQVMEKRKTIDRRGRLWIPKGAPATHAAKKPKHGIRELIYEAFAAEKGPLSSAGIYRALQKLKPDINKSSVDGEINRMRYVAKPALLVQVGMGENGGGLYNLTNGGGSTHTAN